MALIDFQQEDGAVTCGEALACSTTSSTQPNQIEILATQGGTPGVGSSTSRMSTGSKSRTVYYDLPIPAGADGSSGAWTVRVNFAGGSGDLKLDDVHICQVDNACANKATIGSTTGANLSSTTGVTTVTITQPSAVTLAADDRVFIVCTLLGNHAHGNNIYEINHDQIINSPWDDGGAAEGGIRARYGMLLGVE